jgi:hypothetical protein
MGYNRNTARAVVYGPEEHGGIGIMSLYAKQLLAQITALIQHTRLESPLGRTIMINLECTDNCRNPEPSVHGHETNSSHGRQMV